jgi:hypothetical protein
MFILYRILKHKIIICIFLYLQLYIRSSNLIYKSISVLYYLYNINFDNIFCSLKQRTFLKKDFNKKINFYLHFLFIIHRVILQKSAISVS